MFVWDWAPSEAVTYWVSTKGRYLRDLTLVANGNEHVVKLSQELIAWGRVTDAQTGEPVKSFRAIPVTEFRPQFLLTSHKDAVPGTEGEYQLRVTDSSEPSHRYRVRLEAPGYRSLLSEQSLGPDDGRVETNFTLEARPRSHRARRRSRRQGRWREPRSSRERRPMFR